MITYHDGDLLKSGCDIIAHQVNEYGIMGAGLAAQIKEKYPEVDVGYRDVICVAGDSGINLGGYACIVGINGTKQHIANCFTQRNGFTDYEDLKQAVKQVRAFAKIYKAKTVGIPYKYGCGIARGDWKEVEKIWTDAFKDSDIELQIWRFNGNE